MLEEREISKTIKAAFPHTIPVLLGYIFMGIAFGILLSSKGYSFLWAAFMAIIMFAGTGQFVAINMLVPGYSLLQVFFLELIVNARHIFYGLSLLDKFKDMGKKKPYMIWALTDETYALLVAANPPDYVDAKKFRFWIAVLDHTYWIIGCALGGLIGSLITFNTKGIDFVMTALFIVITLDQWKDANSHIPAILGLFISILCLLIFGANNFLIPALLLILAALIFFRKHIEAKEGAKKEETSC